MRLPPRTVCVVFLGTLCAHGTATSADVKFEEEILVADITTAQMLVSVRGVRVAAVIPKGSRQAVVVDGVEGPRFDQIATPGILDFDGMGGRSMPSHQIEPNHAGQVVRSFGGGGGGSVMFNRDGTHHAYVGRSGNDLVLILDHKEVHRGPYTNINWLAFSPDGNRLVAITADKDGLNRVIVDGQAGPAGVAISEVFFTPDGAHYAYTGKNNDAQQTPWTVVDGRQVKFLGEIVGFASTGTLFTRAFANYTHILLANGKPMAQASDFTILALSGTRLIMQVTPPLGTPPRKQPSVVTVDGQIVPGTEDVNVAGTWLSPDGKHYAVLCKRYSPVSETFMIVDGKKELNYQNIWDSDPFKPSFSPDSSKFLYVATATNGQTFVVVNGEESDGVQGIRTNPVWSTTGSRLAWGGVTAAQKQLFYLDGKLTPLPKNQQPGAFFRFSPDGKRTSWVCGNAALTLVVDGKEIPDVTGLGFIGVEGVDGQYATLRFSPDGKHTAYNAHDAKNIAKQGLWVDGKLITPTTLPQANRVTFTPDSQHVFWAAIGLRPDGQGGYRVFVDGREVLSYASSVLDNTPGAWEMGADGTLTLLGVDDGALKRYRIPPPADSNIASMLAAAGGAPVAAASLAAPAPAPTPVATPAPMPTVTRTPVARAAPAPAADGAAAAAALTWNELVARPDLWPTQCTLKVALRFQGGVTIAAGQKINVHRLTATEVEGATLDGRTDFAAEPDETDALAVARTAYAQLTAKQRALTYAALLQRQDLWPLRVITSQTFELNSGTVVRAGDELIVLDVKPGQLFVESKKLNATFDVAPEATDFMAQARRFVEDESAGPRLLAERKRVEARGRVVAELDGKLVSSTTGQPAPLDENALPRYLVFLRGSSTCSITRQFLPSLVKYDQGARAKQPQYEIIYLSTETVADTGTFARQSGFSWRAIEYEKTGTVPSISPVIDGRLPQLIVVDRSGRVLVNGIQSTAPAALQQLDALLKQ